MRPDRITVTCWHDPVVERHGHPAGDLYVETYWLPVIGPTALLLLRRLTRQIEVSGESEVSLPALAQAMGLSRSTQRLSAFDRALDRLLMFGLALENGSGSNLAVRTVVPTLPGRLLKRLPTTLQNAHPYPAAIS